MATPTSNQLPVDQFNAIMANFNLINGKMDGFISEMKVLNTRLDTCETDVKNCYAELYSVKEQLNQLQQQNRACTIRIFSLPMSEEERNTTDPSGKVTAKLVYDRILKPVMNHAKEKQLLATVPTLPNCITECFRIRPGSSTLAKPAPIIVKLASTTLKSAIFRAKNDSLPPPTDAEKAAGLKRFHITEDLTHASYDCLQALRANDKIERAWSVGGEVRFTRKGDTTNHVHKVKSVFDPISLIVG